MISRPALLFSFLSLLLGSCASAPPSGTIEERLHAVGMQMDLAQAVADEIEPRYDESKDALTAGMEREKWLGNRLVRERNRLMQYQEQQRSLALRIADQRERGVSEYKISINEDIGRYIERAIQKTQLYVTELETELSERAQTNLDLRIAHEAVVAEREAISHRMDQIR